MYVVSGTTGNTGSVVAKSLLSKGLPVRVIARSEEKGTAFKDAGAEVAVPEDQWLGILTNHNSPKNGESVAEMFKCINSGYINFETENQIAGKVTIEDYAREALK